MDRRRFLANVGKLSALSVLSQLYPKVSLADYSRAMGKKKLVIIEFNGGWDVTLATDPWKEAVRPEANDMFIEYTEDQRISFGEGLVGPAMRGLKSHFSDIAIINGVHISEADNGHTGARNYMFSGNGGGRYPYLVLEFADLVNDSVFGPISKLPLLTAGRKATQSSFDIVSQLSQIESSKIIRDESGTELSSARNILADNLAKFVEFQNLMKALPSGPTNEEKILAAAFRSQMSSSGVITVSDSLDSHGAHQSNHIRNLSAGFDRVSEIFSLFKSIPYEDSTLFQHTTFLIISEFARTPALNANGGKDHNPMTNSVILAGYGIKGGQSVGGSRLITRANSNTGMSYHIANAILPTTWQQARNRSEAQSGGLIIRPENIMATIAEALGLPRKLFGCAKPRDFAILPVIRSF